MMRRMSDDPTGLYARLEVEPTAAPEAIAAAFRHKARLLHPDVTGTGNAEAFMWVKEAYDVLIPIRVDVDSPGGSESLGPSIR